MSIAKDGSLANDITEDTLTTLCGVGGVTAKKVFRTMCLMLWHERKKDADEMESSIYRSSQGVLYSLLLEDLKQCNSVKKNQKMYEFIRDNLYYSRVAGEVVGLDRFRQAAYSETFEDMAEELLYYIFSKDAVEGLQRNGVLPNTGLCLGYFIDRYDVE